VTGSTPVLATIGKTVF